MGALQSSHRQAQFTALGKMGWLIALIMGSVFLVPMPVDAIFGLGLLLLLLTHTEAAESARRITRDRLFWCGSALLLYLGASAFWSLGMDWMGVTQIWLRIAFIMTFTLVVAASLSELPGCETRIRHAVILGVLVCALITIVWFYLVPPADARLQGLFRFNNPGRAGRMYSATLPFALCVIQVDRGRWRALGVCALVAAGVALLLTDTRAAWLAGAVGMMVYGIATHQRDSLRFTGVLVFCCVVAALFALWAIDNTTVRSSLFPRGDSFRLGIWSEHFKHVLEGNYWFGRGQLVENWVVVDGHRFRGAHNMYLSILGQGGVVGLLLFLTTLAWVGIRLLLHLDLSQARLGLGLLLAGCAAFLLNGDRIIDKVNFVWFVLWFPMGIALAVPNTRRHPGTTSQPSAALND
ncbi:MAG: O-antigen ligase family protein [Gammaproteobacteria bacterium]|nr:O-antigen ligase family protein [Gammaproteobacteria bacterium]